jgi:hypothetical protein
MLRKIDSREIISMADAAQEYSEYHICMVLTELFDGFRADMGYVFYVADSEDEFMMIPEAEKEGKRFAWFSGNHADQGIYVGGIVIQNEFA